MGSHLKSKCAKYLKCTLLTYAQHQCKTENCLDRCTYYARRSSTAVSTGQKVKVKYDHGVCVDTTVYLDTVRFNGLEVANQPFGGAYRMTGFEHGFGMYYMYSKVTNEFASNKSDKTAILGSVVTLTSIGRRCMPMV